MFKPTCAWIKKEQAAAKRAAKAKKPGEIRGVGDPWPDSGGIIIGPKAATCRARAKAIVVYASAIGIKRGLLPADMTGWSGRAGVEFNGACNVFFSADKMAKPIMVPVRNLDFVAAEPVFEMIEPAIEEMALAA